MASLLESRTARITTRYEILQTTLASNVGALVDKIVDIKNSSKVSLYQRDTFESTNSTTRVKKTINSASLHGIPIAEDEKIVYPDGREGRIRQLISEHYNFCTIEYDGNFIELSLDQINGNRRNKVKLFNLNGDNVWNKHVLEACLEFGIKLP